MTQLAQNLGMNVVAEGVEHEQQAEILREMGCHKVQGYWYGRPMSGSAFVATLGLAA